MFLWGGVFGVSFALVAWLVGTLLTQVVLQRSPANADATVQLLAVVEVVIFVLCVAIASFLAGLFSKRFVSGIIAGAAFILVSQGLSLIFSLAALSRGSSVRALILLAEQTVIVTLLYGLVAAGLGAGFGALGALLGRAIGRSSRKDETSRS
jgi:hypothetical protein